MKVKYQYQIIIYFSCIVFLQNSFGQDIQKSQSEKFQQANDLYNSSQYEKSIQIYFEIRNYYPNIIMISM